MFLCNVTNYFGVKMDIIEKLSNVDTIDDYTSLSQHELKNPEESKLTLGNSFFAVQALTKIKVFELEYFEKHQKNGISIAIIKEILNLPPSKSEARGHIHIVALFQFWVENLRQISASDTAQWEFLTTICGLVKILKTKNNVNISTIVVPLAETLLERAANEKLDVTQTTDVIQFLNTFIDDGESDILNGLQVRHQKYFIKISEKLASCKEHESQMTMMRLLVNCLPDKENKEQVNLSAYSKLKTYKKREKSGYNKYSNNKPSNISEKSLSTVSTTSLAQLHTKLVNLPHKIYYPKEPHSVCVAPDLSHVTELSEPDTLLSDSSIHKRPRVAAVRTKRSARNTPKPEKILDDTCDENSNCLLSETFESRDDSFINDTSEQIDCTNLPVPRENVPTLVFDTPVVEPDTLVGKRDLTIDSTSSSDENFAVSEVVQALVHKSNDQDNEVAKTKDNPDKLTTDESTTEVINDTPFAFVNVRKRNIEKDNNILNIDDVFKADDIHTNIVIDPAIARRINNSSSEASDAEENNIVVQTKMTTRSNSKDRTAQITCAPDEKDKAAKVTRKTKRVNAKKQVKDVVDDANVQNDPDVTTANQNDDTIVRTSKRRRKLYSYKEDAVSEETMDDDDFDGVLTSPNGENRQELPRRKRTRNRKSIVQKKNDIEASPSTKRKDELFNAVKDKIENFEPVVLVDKMKDKNEVYNFSESDSENDKKGKKKLYKSIRSKWPRRSAEGTEQVRESNVGKELDNSIQEVVSEDVDSNEIQPTLDVSKMKMIPEVKKKQTPKNQKAKNKQPKKRAPKKKKAPAKKVEKLIIAVEEKGSPLPPLIIEKEMPVGNNSTSSILGDCGDQDDMHDLNSIEIGGEAEIFSNFFTDCPQENVLEGNKLREEIDNYVDAPPETGTKNTKEIPKIFMKGQGGRIDSSPQIIVKEHLPENNIEPEILCDLPEVDDVVKACTPRKTTPRTVKKKVNDCPPTPVRIKEITAGKESKHKGKEKFQSAKKGRAKHNDLPKMTEKKNVTVDNLIAGEANSLQIEDYDLVVIGDNVVLKETPKQKHSAKTQKVQDEDTEDTGGSYDVDYPVEVVMTRETMDIKKKTKAAKIRERAKRSQSNIAVIDDIFEDEQPVLKRDKRQNNILDTEHLKQKTPKDKKLNKTFKNIDLTVENSPKRTVTPKSPSISPKNYLIDEMPRERSPIVLMERLSSEVVNKYLDDSDQNVTSPKRKKRATQISPIPSIVLEDILIDMPRNIRSNAASTPMSGSQSTGKNRWSPHPLLSLSPMNQEKRVEVKEPDRQNSMSSEDFTPVSKVSEKSQEIMASDCLGNVLELMDTSLAGIFERTNESLKKIFAEMDDRRKKKEKEQDKLIKTFMRDMERRCVELQDQYKQLEHTYSDSHLKQRIFKLLEEDSKKKEAMIALLKEDAGIRSTNETG